MAALTITKSVFDNGSRNYRATYSFIGDGSNVISGYVAADPTATGDMGVPFSGNTLYPLTNLKIIKMRYNLAAGFSIGVLWDASSAVIAWELFGFGHQNFMKEGGLSGKPLSNGVPTAPAGLTGKILFTQKPDAALTAGTAGTIELWLRKNISQ